MNVVTCEELRKRFPGCLALDDVRLQIETGKVVGLLGPNGAGKTTLIKLLNGLLMPDAGQVLIDGQAPGPYTKSIVSYLPDRVYFPDWMRVRDLFALFTDFYADFDQAKAADMCRALGIEEQMRLKTMSKGTKEKVQLIMVMSRRAKLYLLDEPIAGVDPAAREYILGTIINNYGEDGTVLLSTHLISDVERILDEVIFIYNGKIFLHEAIDTLKEREGKSVDEVFRDTFRMTPYRGYAAPQEQYVQRADWSPEQGLVWKDQQEQGGERHDR